MGQENSTNEFIEAVQSAGPTDILINNVGASPSRNFLYMTDDDWRSLHELNLLSAVRCTRAFLPHMREQKWGRVVMVSSESHRTPRRLSFDKFPLSKDKYKFMGVPQHTKIDLEQV